jgi:acetyltransferase-like isoleucine patch superfamily enzyme
VLKIINDLFKRILQVIALYAPGSVSVRPFLHRLRGVHVGDNCFIGTDVILETEHPEKIFLDSNVAISVRTVLIAHFRGGAGVDKFKNQKYSIVVEKNVFIGPGCIILPFVTIGEGSVVSAGSVVTSSVPPRTMVQGNPAKPVATCGVPLYPDTISYTDFMKNLKPIGGKKKHVIEKNQGN